MTRDQTHRHLLISLLLAFILQGCATSRYVMVRGNSKTVSRKLQDRHIGTTISIFVKSGNKISGRLASYDESYVYLGGEHSQPSTRVPIETIDKIQLEKINENKQAVWVFIAIPMALIFISWGTVAAFD
ncbi:MAG: hypothetical protein ACRBF0_12605 [Calditrichia bacterium]